MPELNEATELPALLHLRGVGFGYGEDTLFRSVDLQSRPGRATVLCGTNGSGKSTLLRLMAGLLPPDEGRVERARDSARGGDPSTVAWLGHALGLKTALSVGDALRFARGLHGANQRMTIDQALASVELPGFEPVPVRDLSAGQRKRVALARLLLTDTPIWLLDEPYANLDPRGCLLVDRLIDRQLRSGGTVVLSVHRPDQAGFTGPRALIDLDADL